MLPGMVQIHNLGRSVKMFISDVPDPEGAVTERDHLGCPVQPATLGLPIDALSKFFH